MRRINAFARSLRTRAAAGAAGIAALAVCVAAAPASSERRLAIDRPGAAHVLFVSNELNNTVAELDAASGKLVRVFSGGGLSGPVGMAVAYGGSEFPFPILYVCNTGANTISQFNVTTGQAIGKGVTVGGALSRPRGLFYQTPFLYIANDGNSTVAVTDPTCSEDGCFSSPIIMKGGGLLQPQGLKIANGSIFVANYTNNTVSVFNAATYAPESVYQTLPDGPEGVAVADGKLFVSTGLNGGTVAVQSAKTGKMLGQLAANALAEPLGMSTGGGVLYVVDHSTNMLSLYNVTTGAPMGTLTSSALDGPVDVDYY